MVQTIYSEIRELRKKNLEEACALAEQNLEAAQNDIWLKRAIGWVYYDKAKLAINDNDADEAIVTLEHIADLEFDAAAETVLAEKLAWVCANIVKSYVDTYQTFKENNVLFQQNARSIIGSMSKLVDIAGEIPMEKPSKGYSRFMKRMHNLFKDRAGYATIFHCIGFDFFSDEDCKPFVTEDGRSVLPSAEQIYLAYTKALLSGIARNDETARLWAEEFLEVLNKTKVKYPKFIWTDYNISRLLISLNRTNEATDYCVEFIKRKPKESWAWECLGQIYEAIDVELSVSCYCMSLSCRADEDMLVSTMESAATVMAKAGYYNEARTEIERAERVRLAKWGKVPYSLSSLKQQVWYESAISQENNNRFYNEHRDAAMGVIFGAKKIVLITYLNTEKSFASYITDDGKVGFFNYGRLKNKRIKLRQNTMYTVTFIKEGKDGPSDVFAIEEAQMQDHSNLRKEVCGAIRIMTSGIGFIEDCFVPSDLIKRNTLMNGQSVVATAVRSYDRKKSMLSWSVIDIKR